MSKPVNHFKFIDLFAGLGGFRIALETFGGNCVFSSEIDENAKKVYELNFNDVPYGDITQKNENEIPEHDVLCAGFPCQAFSVSGKRLGFEDARGTLFFDVARIIKSKKPKVIFLENVKNFVSHDEGKTFLVIKNTLEELGYNLFYRVLCSSDYKVPQSRERIYIIGFRADLKITNFSFPLPSNKFKTVKDILIKLKPAEINKLEINRPDIHFYRTEDELKNISRPFQIGKINKGGQGERIYSIHAQGITLSAHGGGAAAKTGAYLVDGVIRKLHPKECLAMQGFPSNYKLLSSDNISYKQLGNSVSVPVLKSIFEEILKTDALKNGQTRLQIIAGQRPVQEIQY
jgi:DNA (cytosine-5)-methyltransferase 1